MNNKPICGEWHGYDVMPVEEESCVFKISVDDNEEVRSAWHGRTIDANKNIIHELIKIVTDEF